MSKKKSRGTSLTPAFQPPTVDTSATHSSWQFRCKIDHRDRCVIKPWLAKLSTAGQASLDRTVQHLAPLPQEVWTRPQASKIGDNIYVIHLRDENRTQHRTFGHFHPSDHSAVLTLTGYEKDGTYFPDNYERITAEHRTSCDANHDRLTIRCRYADAAISTTLEKLSDYHRECQSCRKCDDIHSDPD